MNRDARLSIIFTQFDNSAKQFCCETDGIFCELSREYKGGDKPRNLKYCFAKIFYPSFVLKFTYTAHGPMDLVNSILSCSVFFDKNEDATGIPLPLLTDYCNQDVTAPMCIPFITNESGMIQAFDCIGGVLKGLLPEFANISCSSQSRNRIMNSYVDEMKFIFGIDELTEDNIGILELSDSFFTMRFTSTAFINFIKGNYTKAAKQLKKAKKLTGYEHRMIAFWSSAQQSEFPELSAIAASAETYNSQGVQKADFKEFSTMFLSWLLMTPIISAVFVGLYFLLVWIEGQRSVCLLGPSYNFPYCILCGFVLSIAVSYFTRHTFYKLFHKKDYEKFCEMDSIQNGGGADKFMKGFTIVILVLCVFTCILTAKWNLNFLSDGFIDNSEYFSLQGDFYSYKDIERVYYKPDRVNDFGDTLAFPSYVIVLKNGKEIDLYEHGDISDYETALIDHLREQGVPIEEASPN